MLNWIDTLERGIELSSITEVSDAVVVTISEETEM